MMMTKRQLVLFLKGSLMPKNENKEWMEVADFPFYEIHPLEGIRRKGKEKTLRGRNWLGYPKVTLMRDGAKHEKRIHKLVGEHFVENPNNLPIVNHKDSDRSNHRYDNLEWVNNSGNQLHRWKTQKDGIVKKKYEREYGIKVGKGELLAVKNKPLLKAAITFADVKRIKAQRKLKAKGLSGLVMKKMMKEESYKAAGMGPLRRAINHKLPFNSVIT